MFFTEICELVWCVVKATEAKGERLQLAPEEGDLAEVTPQWMSRKDGCMVGASLQRRLQGRLKNSPCW